MARPLRAHANRRGSLPPDESALLLEQRDHSERARIVLDSFGKRIVDSGDAMHEHQGTDRANAARHMEELLVDAGRITETLADALAAEGEMAAVMSSLAGVDHKQVMVVVAHEFIWDVAA